MAQLARCPACYSEIELPVELASSEAPHARAKCPACDETFIVADAKPRSVQQAVLIDDADELTDEATAEPNTPSTAPTLGAATLASFLGDATPNTDGETSPAESSSDTGGVALGEFKSLDELFRKTTATTESTPPAEALEPPKATVPHPDEPIESASSMEVPRDESTDQIARADEHDEPSPEADRMRPTLGDLFAADSNKGTAKADAQESGVYDPVEEPSDDAEFAEGESNSDSKSTLDDLIGATLDDFAPASFTPQGSDALGEDSPTTTDNDPAEVAATGEETSAFDFTVGEPSDADDLDSSKSLRAAMGFGGDEPLEVADDQLALAGVAAADDHDHDHQHDGGMSFAQVEAPRGQVATRKRRSPSVARTMFGVASGGAVGIAAGYLVLLWILHWQGTTNEPLDLAKYYPDAVKPASFRDALPASESPVAMKEEASRTDQQPGSEAATEPPGDVELLNFESDAEDTAPLPWDDAAEPAAIEPETEQPTTKVAIEGAPEYTAAQLQQFTSLANDAGPALVAAGPIDRAKGSSYATLAQLADALTFCEGPSDASWKHEARQQFPSLMATPRSRDEIAQIAGFWLNSEKRGHGGIFFSGTPNAGRQQGNIAEYEFTLPTGQQLTVLTPNALPTYVTNSPAVAVVGSVVNDPASHIEGYLGTASQVIWSEDFMAVGE